MEYVNLGRTGLKVSRLCLGCMTYGEPDRGNHAWTLSEDESRPFIKRALDLGITFFDTANVYSDGSSEEIVGRALKDYARRDGIVLATKVHGRTHPDANGQGLSRKHIMTEIDASLKRLGTDYVDLYQIHRYDPETPIEETLEALHDVVKSGKARYIGASSMYAWQFCRALYLADRHGWTRFVSMQNHYKPALPRGRARDGGAVPRRGRRHDPVEPTGAWASHSSTGHQHQPCRDRCFRQDALPRLRRLGSRRHRSCRRSRGGQGLALAPAWRWLGCCRSPA